MGPVVKSIQKLWVWKAHFRHTVSMCATVHALQPTYYFITGHTGKRGTQLTWIVIVWLYNKGKRGDGWNKQQMPNT